MTATPKQGTTRRTALAGAGALLAAPALSQGAFPSRPITLIVTFAAGGGVDVTSRLIAEALSEKLGQRVVVENRGGGATIPATQGVVNAAPDGYTLLAAPTTMVINPAFRPTMPFDWRADLLPVALMAKLPFVVVMRKDAPQATMKDLEALAKGRAARPLLYASGGSGTVAHLAGELFSARIGQPMQHVPFRGEGPAIGDLLAGNIDVTFATLAGVAGQVEAGTLKALGVTTAERSRLLKDVPTVAEQGYPDYDVSAWIALTLPKAADPSVARALGAALEAALAEPALQDRLHRAGAIPAAKGFDVAAFMRREAAIWEKVVKDAGLKAE
jgi:tripartite-type tricarboxylate transporter receptor subunit TctC